MKAIAQQVRLVGSEAEHGDRHLNVNKTERELSVAVGTVLIGLGLERVFKLRGLIAAGLGVAMVYRGVTGHCHLYDALGLNTRSPDQKREVDGDEETERESASYIGGNQVDKDRFDKLRTTQVERGRDEEEAIGIAAEEVKELRRREGRSKDDDGAYPDEHDEVWERK